MEEKQNGYHIKELKEISPLLYDFVFHASGMDRNHRVLKVIKQSENPPNDIIEELEGMGVFVTCLLNDDIHHAKLNATNLMDEKILHEVIVKGDYDTNTVI